MQCLYELKNDQVMIMHCHWVTGLHLLMQVATSQKVANASGRDVFILRVNWA